ncbi:hypothetical protein XELAEV_18006319mg [Xenopus laevis]|uniref:SEA domain-containing protein n=1 Tax=Xenopus laevis TaxID=8355 RepID=A0A974DZX2_XENLA|nr:hypothetical protein XELAEV_18006319mg [Xenopus laevis]
MSTAGTTNLPTVSKALGTQTSSTSPAGVNITTTKTLSTPAPTKTVMSTTGTTTLPTVSKALGTQTSATSSAGINATTIKTLSTPAPTKTVTSTAGTTTLPTVSKALGTQTSATSSAGVITTTIKTLSTPAPTKTVTSTAGTRALPSVTALGTSATSSGINTTTTKTLFTPAPTKTVPSTARTTALPIVSTALRTQTSATSSTTIKTLTTPAPTAVVEPPVNAITQSPVQGVQTEDITINCTFTSLIYSNDFGTRNSTAFNSTATYIISLLDDAFKKSTISSKYRNCKIDNFMLAPLGTKVNSVCSINKETTGHQFDKVVFYGELEDVTNNVTIWGKYTLDKNSLFVNGYQKPIIITTLMPTTTAKPTTTTTTPTTTTTTPTTTKTTTPTTTTKTTVTTSKTPVLIFGPKQFFLNFTITNLFHTTTLDNKDSDNYSLNKNNIDKLLNLVFNNSILKDRFKNCTVTAFRPTPKSLYTTTEAMCTFDVDLLAKVIDDQFIKDVFFNGTKDGITLGNYTLDKTSINVAGYTPEQPTTQAPTTIMTITTTTVQSIAPGDKRYDISFTIYNDYVPSDPVEFEKKKLSIEEEMNKLYRNSPLGKKFKFCKVSAMRNGSIIPLCGCYFEDDPTVTLDSVRKEFYDGIINGTLLGPFFKIKDISIQEISSTNELPFWAIILICLAVLLGLILLFLVIFLLVFCLRKRKGSFDVTDSIYGTYFPHLDMRRLY